MIEADHLICYYLSMQVPFVITLFGSLSPVVRRMGAKMPSAVTVSVPGSKKVTLMILDNHFVRTASDLL